MGIIIVKCPKCGAKVIARTGNCMFCGHKLDEPYNLGDDKEFEISHRLAKRPAHKKDFVAQKKPKPDPVQVVSIAVLTFSILAILTYVGLVLSGTTQGFFTTSEPATEEGRALKELSILQKAETKYLKYTTRYGNFVELRNAGYISDIEIKSIEPTTLVTRNGTFTLSTAKPGLTFMIFTETLSGTASWTIDQDSRNVMQTHNIE